MKRKIFLTFPPNYEPNGIFLYSLIVAAKKISAENGPFDVFLYVLRVEKKITAKVNAFMLPDEEVDLNFQKEINDNYQNKLKI